MATPRPKSADAGKRSQNDANAGIAGSVTAHRKRPATIIGLRPSRSESLPESGLGGTGGGNWAPITSAIWASFRPTPLSYAGEKPRKGPQPTYISGSSDDAPSTARPLRT